MSVVGVSVQKLQGISTLLRVNQRLASGELPAREILEGVLLACAGALLLTPGFITDTLGFSLLTPPIRRWLAGRVVSRGWLQAGGSSRGFYWSSHEEFRQSGPRVYEGEYSTDKSRPDPGLDSPPRNKPD